MTATPETTFRISPVVFVDLDGGIYDNSARRHIIEPILSSEARRAMPPAQVSSIWARYAEAAAHDTLNMHIVELLQSMKARTPNLEVWFMGDRKPALTDIAIRELQTAGFLTDKFKGMITSRTGRFSFWNDFRIKEYYLVKFFISKGLIPTLALDDRDETLEMYVSHGVDVLKVMNQSVIPSSVTLKYVSKEDLDL